MTELDELNIHSFIIKIWLEKRAETDRPVAWRGNITHVASGQREHLQNLNDVSVFIASCLENMNVDTATGTVSGPENRRKRNKTAKSLL